MPSPLRLALALALLAAPAAAAPPKPHKFNVAKCQAILEAGNEATRTLKAIMAAAKVASCADFPLEGGMTQLPGISLAGQGLTDLSPFQLLHFRESQIDLSNNPVSEVGALANTGASRLVLSHTKVKSAAVLAALGPELVLDGNEIDDPQKLGTGSLLAYFSLRENRSARGADYDRALETMYRLYSMFSDEISNPRYRGKLDLPGLRAVLAPRLARYITFKDAPVEAVLEDAQRFYAGKKAISYRIDLRTFQVQKQNDQVVASYALGYGWEDDDLKVADRNADAYRQIHRNKRVQAQVQVVFDPSFHVVSYGETYQRKKFPVRRTTWGTKDLRDAVAYMAGEKAAEEIARVKIPKGSVLEDNFEGVGIFRPRSSDDGFYRVLYKGQALWALECELDEESNEGTLFFDHNAQ